LRYLPYSSYPQLIYFLQHHCIESEAHAKILPLILSSLYQAEIIDEDAIICWYNTSTGSIRDSAKPFVDWLNEAEEEDEEENDGDN
jgi:hypothetical protein